MRMRPGTGLESIPHQNPEREQKKFFFNYNRSGRPRKEKISNIFRVNTHGYIVSGISITVLLLFRYFLLP